MLLSSPTHWQSGRKLTDGAQHADTYSPLALWPLPETGIKPQDVGNVC